MRDQSEERISKRKYSKISLQKRVKLMKMVTEEGQAVTKAAKKLSIKLCTARIILKKYKETGRFPMKNPRQRTAPKTETSCPSPPPPSPPLAPKDPLPPQTTNCSSFTSPCDFPQQEPIYYPYWMWYNAYCSFLCAEGAQLNF